MMRKDRKQGESGARLSNDYRQSSDKLPWQQKPSLSCAARSNTTTFDQVKTHFYVSLGKKFLSRNTEGQHSQAISGVISVTECEIAEGILESEDPQAHTLCYIRNMEGLNNDVAHEKNAQRFMDCVEQDGKVLT